MKKQLRCEVCGKKVDSENELNDYDGLFINDGYQACDECTDALMESIKEVVSRIRDRALSNVQKDNM